MHQRVATDMSCTTCLWEVFTVLYVVTAIKFSFQRDESRIRQRECQTALAWRPAAELGCQHYALFLKFYPADELARFPV